MIDWVFWGKILSTLLAALFGMVGLLKDFKDKATGRITRYGYVSLVGIILSSVLGVTIQAIEQYESNLNKAKSTQQTLDIVKSTGESVSEIKRVLWRIGKPIIYADFIFTCDSESANFCKYYLSNPQTKKKMKREEARWFSDLYVSVDFFKDKKSFDKAVAGSDLDADLEYRFTTSQNVNDNGASKDGSNNITFYERGDATDKISAGVSAKSLSVLSANGKILSINDLNNAYVLILGLPKQFSLKELKMQTDTGIDAHISLHDCANEIHPTFLPDGTPTVYNHFGEYSIACRVSADN